MAKKILLEINDENLHKAMQKLAEDDNRTLKYTTEKALWQYVRKYEKITVDTQ